MERLSLKEINVASQESFCSDDDEVENSFNSLGFLNMICLAIANMICTFGSFYFLIQCHWCCKVQEIETNLCLIGLV